MAIPTATNSNITLNTSAFQTVLASNANRTYVRLYNNNFNDVCINLCVVASAVADTGIIIKGGESWDMPTGAIYTGEISGKGCRGDSQLIIVEY